MGVCQKGLLILAKKLNRQLFKMQHVLVLLQKLQNREKLPDPIMLPDICDRI